MRRRPAVAAGGALVVAVLAGGSGPAAAVARGPDPATVWPVAPECPSRGHAAVADDLAGVLRTHRFVFLGSTHGGIKRHRLLLCLLSRPAFRDRVTDLVVEFVSGAHQALLDRYLIELAELPRDTLRPLALDTDHPRLLATLPQVPEFVEAVRAVNAGLERSRRIRVLGGSATVEWSRVRKPEDLAPHPFKTNWTAHLVTAHLAPSPGARVLVVYGDGHIQHGGTLTGDVEAAIPGDSLFVIGTIASPGAGEEHLVAAFGDPDEPFFLVGAEFPVVEALPDDLFYARPETLAEKVDALLYLGPSPDSTLEGTVPFTDAERRELERREAIQGGATLEMRFGGRERWFEDHPRDLPPDPRSREAPSRDGADDGDPRRPGRGEG